MAKRSNGEGYIRRRADGRWEVRIMDGYTDDGRSNIINFYGRTQKEVREKLKVYQEAKLSGINMGLKYTFNTWAISGLNTTRIRSQLPHRKATDTRSVF